ncbi:MAG: DUF2306 domain-containing protein [Anaerolineales bacterium]|nr:DUF2306 domain-containing protein [Anaerolineales bacterium]
MKADIHSNDSFRDLSRKTRAQNRKGAAVWLVPALILLSIIPLIFGVLRLHELASGAEITPENARFFASPLPVVLHIVGAGIFAIFGALQFVSRLWKRGNKWHRRAGRILVPCGLIVGLSGLWMTIFYPRPEDASGLLYVLRLLFGTGMVLAIILGFVAIRQRDIARHRAWMIRAYAIGLGAGTQVLTGIVGAVILGTPNEFESAVLMGAAWVINLAVAEWAIYRQPSKNGRLPSTVISDMQ